MNVPHYFEKRGQTNHGSLKPESVYGIPPNGRNLRSVWEFSTAATPEAHFATFPAALPARCIAASCPREGCATCGTARDDSGKQRKARGRSPDSRGTGAAEAGKGRRPKGRAVEFCGAGARVSKWEEAFKVHLELTDGQAAIVAELMLRGPQTEGELRQRASRMAGIGDQGALAQLLEGLSAREAPLVRRLSAPGRARGVIWAHTLYPEGEEPSPDESPPAP